MNNKLLRGIFIFSCSSMLMLTSFQTMAGATMKIDDTKWLSLGVGVRSSFSAVEDAAPNGDSYSAGFDLDNARIYINGQIHEYIKFEFNTECVFCTSSALRDYTVLDAVGKFEFSPQFNIWAGRVLVPADRVEMDGPFYGNVYENFKTPFYPADFSVTFGSGGAGVLNRDHGVALWGATGEDNRFQYAFGVFDGLNSTSTTGPNQDDTNLYAARFAYNFWEVEQNPGYYTSSTYYGGLGDIFTIGYAVQYQQDGAGSFDNPGDFLGMNVDILIEKVLASKNVLTLEAEYKYFDAGFNVAAFGDADCFCMFDGDAWTATALYLFNEPIGLGKIQPYVRYTAINPDHSSFRKEYEAGLNYVISGHNARLALYYQYGDIATKSIVAFAPGVTGEDVSAIKLGMELQF